MQRPANRPPYRPASDGYPKGWPQPAGAITYRLNGTQVGRGNILNIAGAGITAVPLPDGITYDISGSGGLGVSSLNTLTGAVVLAPGTNISLVPAGNTITINATGGGTIGGTIDATQVGYGSALDTLTSDADFTRSLVDGTTRIATFGSNQIFQIDSSQFHFGNGTNFIDLILQRIVGQIDSLYLGQDAGNLGIESGTGRNTGMGYGVMRAVTTGADNAIFGQASGFALTTGGLNAFFGSSAGRFTVDGNQNVFVGEEAGYSNTSGSANTFVGLKAGYLNTTATGNVAIGQSAGQNNVIGEHNVFVGQTAGSVNTASDNTFIGYQAGFLNVGAAGNVFVGKEAGRTNVTGIANTYIGTEAGKVATSSGGTLIGYQAGFNIIGGAGNTYIGNSSGFLTTTGYSNTAIGGIAFYNNVGGIYNVAIGEGAGYGNINGYQNTYIGFNSGRSVEGAFNTFIGQRTGYTITTGNSNVLIGDATGDGTITTANSLTLLGSGANSSTASRSFSIGIGAGAIVTADNQLVMGSVGAPVTDVFIGQGVSSATPNPVYIQPANSTLIADNPGSTLIIRSGASTGAAASPNIAFQISKPGAPGSALNTFSTVLEINGTDGGLSINGAYTMPLVDGGAGDVMVTDGAGTVSFSPAVVVTSATYGPTATGVSNVTIVTAGAAQYMRVGNVVTVAGSILVQPTAAAQFIFTLSLPINSAYGSNNSQVSGTGASITIANLNMWIGMGTSNEATFVGNGVGAGVTAAFNYHYTYEIV